MLISLFNTSLRTAFFFLCTVVESRYFKYVLVTIKMLFMTSYSDWVFVLA